MYFFYLSSKRQKQAEEKSKFETKCKKKKKFIKIFIDKIVNTRNRLFVTNTRF